MHAERFQTVKFPIMKFTVAGLFLIVAAAALGESRFEVSSIRPAPNATPQDVRYFFRGNRFEAKAVTLGDIFQVLANGELYRIVGGPPWMKTDRFDIVATSDHEVPPAEQLDAIMALLADRFALKSHKETRELPGLILRAERTPPRIKAAGADEKYSVRPDGQGRWTFTGVPIGALTNFLSQMNQAPTTDATELKGKFDFVLMTTDIPAEPGVAWGERVNAAVEALGFRVDRGNFPFEVTVVDSCERPNGN
jgi:uncharacterized protein (TIGR03435 family)